jgi:hypothetical protein
MGVTGPWRQLWKTLGTNVRPEFALAVRSSAQALGMTQGAWLRMAAEEKLAREQAPSLVPEDAILIPTTIAGETP